MRQLWLTLACGLQGRTYLSFLVCPLPVLVLIVILGRIASGRDCRLWATSLGMG